MKRALDIAIVGYGIAGIAAAIRLRNLGHRITHFDRNDPPVMVGAGMLLHPAGLRQLDQLGLMDDALACGAPVKRICAQTKEGRRWMDLDYGDVAADQFGLGIQRGALHRLLSSADVGRNQIRGGCRIAGLDAKRGYAMEDSGILHGPFDLIVVADGTSSLLRNRIAPLRYERSSKSAALVGLLDDPEGLAGDRLKQYFDAGRHLSVWPVGRESLNGLSRCSIAINVPREDAAAFRDQGAWRPLIARLCPRISALVNDDVRNESLHIFTYRDVELSQCFLGRTVVIGDAAHSMSPQLGTGAQLAMEDAASLATALNQHDVLSDALQAYALIRSRQLRRYHRASRWLTPLFQSQSRIVAMLRDYLFANAMQLPFAKRFAHALLS